MASSTIDIIIDGKGATSGANTTRVEVALAAVEVSDVEVLDPHAVGRNRDPVADVVSPVDDHMVAINSAQVQPRRADSHRRTGRSRSSVSRDRPSSPSAEPRFTASARLCCASS